MGSAFDDAAMIDDEDAIGTDDARQTMGENQSRAAGHPAGRELSE